MTRSTQTGPTRAASKPPTVWVLAGDKVGDRAQLLTLAQALGWPFEVKDLVHNGFHRLPNLLLGASRFSLDRGGSSPLSPPWPDLVLSCGRRSVPVARWIRRRSGGRVKLVHLGRPWAPLALFDLVITTPQYRLPPRPNVVQNIAPLNRADPDKLAAAAAAWAPRLAELPRPFVALLVGGNSRPYVIDPDAARDLGRQASALAESLGGSVLASTSRRTPAAAADALFGALSAPNFGYRWDKGGENPYSAYLALADAIVATGDSASMLSEALGTGKPVYIYDLPERPDWRLRTARWLRRRAEEGRGGAVTRLYDRLVDLGLLTSTRDLSFFQEALIENGWAARLGDPPPRRAAPVAQDLDRALRSLRALFEEP